MKNTYPYEQLGLFYLGRQFETETPDDAVQMPLLLKSKNLTTHAAIIGMTGSGKTGLGIGLIEEAIMDDIPSIIIDPKGDMANLLLSFPKLAPEDFRPWVDPAEAQKRGKTVEQHSKDTASMWKEGLATWGQDENRIDSLRKKTSFSVYTPGSNSGVSVSVLDSFDAPTGDVLEDIDTFTDLVNSAVSGLLSLIEIDDASTKSREYVLLSSIFMHFWRKGENLTIEKIIGAIVNPPFSKVGVFGLDTFFPQQERMDLAMAFNGVIASPAFQGWMCGEPLDIQRILYGHDGSPQTAIFSIAHLGSAERMFFVTILLNKIVSWMRTQQGSSSLKALLYMDEIFGYFPPTANPPSKRPMLLLLKQARAYGVGVVLATQNPVDLDYKGLSNIGTWFVGRLQTPQDQKKVVDGIAGSSGGQLEKGQVARMLDAMKGRQFLLRSAHLDDVLLFETRWVMSYLKGPISLPDIERLMEQRKVNSADADHHIVEGHSEHLTSDVFDHPPLLSEKIVQRYIVHPTADKPNTFEPWLAASAYVRFFNAKRNIDIVSRESVRTYLDEQFLEPAWGEFEENPYSEDELIRNPPSDAHFYKLPSTIVNKKDLRGLIKSYADFLYHNRRLELFRVQSIKLESKPGESLADFQVRISDFLREQKDVEMVKLEEQFQRKQERLETKIERAELKVEKEKSDVKAKTTDTILSFGAAVLGAFLGRKKISVSTISRASTGIKNAGRLAREKGQVKMAEEVLADLYRDVEVLASELEEQSHLLAEKYDPSRYDIETFSLKPRRSDVYDIELFLQWEMVS